MDNIFDKLSMDSKRLSRSVEKEETQPKQGVQELDPDLTDRLRGQSPYIIGIICYNDKSTLNAKKVTAMLSDIMVFRVPKIIVKRFVLDANGNKKYGQDDQGEVLLVDADTKLHVKIRQGLEITDIIVPLAERFAERFDLGDTSRELLANVLTMTRVEQVIEGLERAGVSISPTAIAEVATGPEPDEDSDDAILAEDPTESLGLTFRQLQISEVEEDRVSETEFRELQQQRLSPTPSAQSRRRRSDAGISSPISLRRSSAHTSISGVQSIAITATGPAATTETIAPLVERLSNAKLSDATHDVFHHRSTTSTPSRPESSESQIPDFGGGTSFQFTFNPPASQHLVKNTDVGARNQTGTNESAISRIIVDSSQDFQSDSDALYSSSDHTHGQLVTPTRTIQRVGGHLSSGRSGRINYGGNSFIAQETLADTPHEIGFAGEHLVYKFLEEKLSPSFTPENWTSRNRKKVFSSQLSSGFREKTSPTSHTGTPKGECVGI
ncbi:uncharacterized protein Z519_05656 [Cladophialophora bantiana CBS 173.52]|uniref:Uncharacterized protein n=1 Tax=Cladophialophora bantiana (strain ATCC 10958 / CBS 173.52 / CDC B-1940 / NIH 8579) TaxID=1442370 RepID=A0A0D2HTZ8_CLAB1|nr:uncharacterized protein Z519_05656 [Cladophialophora bantiana CBS 173.52]KIW94340.1 hypothetical protein Z519_05656 [Cladophialophora bantiana CBS 173.52]